MTREHFRTIEIEGQKFEIDTRELKEVRNYRVGDRVKVLKKTYSGYETHAGCIIGVDAFKGLPTIAIAYMPSGSYFSTEAKIEFCYLNAQTKDVEIAPMLEDDLVPTRDTILGAFERAIKKHRDDIGELEVKREWFLRKFGIAFGTTSSDIATATESVS